MEGDGASSEILAVEAGVISTRPTARSKALKKNFTSNTKKLLFVRLNEEL